MYHPCAFLPDQNVSKLKGLLIVLFFFCMNCVYFVSLTGWGPALCLVWRMWGVRKSAWKEIQLQLHWRSCSAACWGSWPPNGTLSFKRSSNCRNILMSIWCPTVFFVCFCIFFCRNSAQDTTMEIKACAVMLTSWTHWKGVCSCRFSFCLGMRLSCNWWMKCLLARMLIAHNIKRTWSQIFLPWKDGCFLN